MANERLEKRVADLLDGSLGLNVFPGPIALVWHSGEPGLFRDNPYMAGLKVGVFYVLICCGLPWLLFSASFIQKPSWSLTFLQIYGGIWSCWATTSTRITSSSILKIIESNIIPELSGRTAGRIDRELRRRFRRSRLLCVS